MGWELGGGVEAEVCYLPLALSFFYFASLPL